MDGCDLVCLGWQHRDRPERLIVRGVAEDLLPEFPENCLLCGRVGPAVNIDGVPAVLAKELGQCSVEGITEFRGDTAGTDMNGRLVFGAELDHQIQVPAIEIVDCKFELHPIGHPGCQFEDVTPNPRVHLIRRRRDAKHTHSGRAATSLSPRSGSGGVVSGRWIENGGSAGSGRHPGPAIDRFQRVEGGFRGHLALS